MNRHTYLFSILTDLQFVEKCWFLLIINDKIYKESYVLKDLQ